ncbi:hypothetical protein JCM10049v2_004690 [Rhodotorula toruloides]
MDDQTAAGSADRDRTQNEACTACRAVKRRCMNEGKGSVCTRCQKMGLSCEYHQLKRGRKPGTQVGSKKRHAASADTGDLDSQESAQPFASTSSQPADSPASGSVRRDWLADLLTQQANGNGAAQSAHPQSFATGMTAAAGSSSAQSPAQAVPAIGGFSLEKLYEERQNVAGDRNDPRQQSLADAFAPRSARRRPQQPEPVFEDAVKAGIVPEEQVPGLFSFYFMHLNPMTSLLDPELHTAAFCRARSAILFTAILTVSAKVCLPVLHGPALKHAKVLLGQAFEAGTNNLELVQALATLVFWQDPTDDSGARKLAYAVRCAFELGIHKRGPRPLPQGELERRHFLNPERTWIYLTIADHRFSTQRGLPKMISNDFRGDAVPWLLEHDSAHFCPHEVGLAPLLELGRLLDIFAVLISPEDGSPSVELMRSLERNVEAWRGKWCLEHTSPATLPLQPSQKSLVRFYAQVLHFQILEVNLYLAIKQSGSTDPIAFDPRLTPPLVFAGCVTSAIKVLDIMERELRYMVYSFDSMWVGAASSAIWLTQNLSGMEPHQRRAAIASINRLQAACSDLSTNQESMSAYTSRLLQHLLSKVRPDATAGPTQGSSETGQAANPQPATMPPPPFVTASLNAATWSTEPNSFGSGHSASHGVGVFTTGGIGNSSGLATRSASPQAWLGLPAAPQETGDGQQVDPSLDIFGANFLTTMMPPSQNWDAPFPADDGVLWESLFPLYHGDP